MQERGQDRSFNRQRNTFTSWSNAGDLQRAQCHAEALPVDDGGTRFVAVSRRVQRKAKIKRSTHFQKLSGWWSTELDLQRRSLAHSQDVYTKT